MLHFVQLYTTTHPTMHQLKPFILALIYNIYNWFKAVCNSSHKAWHFHSGVMLCLYKSWRIFSEECEEWGYITRPLFQRQIRGDALPCSGVSHCDHRSVMRPNPAAKQKTAMYSLRTTPVQGNRNLRIPQDISTNQYQKSDAFTLVAIGGLFYVNVLKSLQKHKFRT